MHSLTDALPVARVLNLAVHLQCNDAGPDQLNLAYILPENPLLEEAHIDNAMFEHLNEGLRVTVPAKCSASLDKPE